MLRLRVERCPRRSDPPHNVSKKGTPNNRTALLMVGMREVLYCLGSLSGEKVGGLAIAAPWRRNKLELEGGKLVLWSIPCSAILRTHTRYLKPRSTDCGFFCFRGIEGVICGPVCLQRSVFSPSRFVTVSDRFSVHRLLPMSNYGGC